MPDVIIIGGGPAGVSAALTVLQRGHKALIVSGAAEDSGLFKAERLNNYPGFPDISGAELMERLNDHAKSAGAELVRGRAIAIMPMGESFGVSVGADFYDSRAVVLATGLPKGAAFPGERELLGRGVSYCATCDGMLYRGKKVAVVSLASDGPEEAEFLRSIGCEVEYFDLTRAKKYAIKGTERAEALIADGAEYPADCVFIFRPGVAPSSLLPGLETEGARIVVSASMETSVPGVFACGDCAGAPYQAAKAAGEGNVAGLSAAKYVENAQRDKT